MGLRPVLQLLEVRRSCCNWWRVRVEVCLEKLFKFALEGQLRLMVPHIPPTSVIQRTESGMRMLGSEQTVHLSTQLKEKQVARLANRPCSHIIGFI